MKSKLLSVWFCVGIAAGFVMAVSAGIISIIKSDLNVWAFFSAAWAFIVLLYNIDKTPKTTQKKRKPVDHPPHLHLQGLKVGDKLKCLIGGYYDGPFVGDTVTVASVLENHKFFRYGPKSPIFKKDFSAVITDADGDIMEFEFDSRYFGRVTEI